MLSDFDLEKPEVIREPIKVVPKCRYFYILISAIIQLLFPRFGILFNIKK